MSIPKYSYFLVRIIFNFRFNPGLEGISPSHTALEWNGDNLNITVFDTGSDFGINILIDPLSNEIKYTKKTIPDI